MTLFTHLSCNQKYQNDEKYFYVVFGTAIRDIHDVGKIVWESLLIDALTHPPTMKTYQEVISNISDKYGPIHLPSGKSILHFDGDKVWNVIRKIFMGLYFIEYNSYLPVETKIIFNLLSPGEQPTPEYYIILKESGKGKYKKLFDYKIKEFPEKNFYQIAILLWDSIIFLGTFKSPSKEIENSSIK